jgi:hypothetical protein
MDDTNYTCRIVVEIFLGKEQLESGEGCVKTGVSL